MMVAADRCTSFDETREAASPRGGRERVRISGVGLVCALGNDPDTVRRSLASPIPPNALSVRVGGKDVAILAVKDVAVESVVSDRRERAMLGPVMQYGVVAAIDALAAAKVDHGFGDRIDVFVATGNGERAAAPEEAAIEAARTSKTPELAGNETLARRIRPTASLSFLPNMLASSISIIARLGGPSRTFTGGMIAGVQAIESACSRLTNGLVDLVLVGGAFNAANTDALAADVLMRMRLGDEAAQWPPLGTASAFLVLEREEHAERRQAPCFGYLAQCHLQARIQKK